MEPCATYDSGGALKKWTSLYKETPQISLRYIFHRTDVYHTVREG